MAKVVMNMSEIIFKCHCNISIIPTEIYFRTKFAQIYYFSFKFYLKIAKTLTKSNFHYFYEDYEIIFEHI